VSGDDASPRAVWIDTDPAIGVPDADVDDGLALVQAFRSPELAVRGVSVVFGNTTLPRAYAIAREVVERFGSAGLPVAAGAEDRDALGRENEAVRALASALEAEPLDVLALGPLTNLGSLVRLRPDLVPRIRSLVAVAARRPGQRFLSVPGQRRPFPDMNFDCDPQAMRDLLTSGLPLCFAPWEVSSHVWIEPEDLDRLEREGGKGGAWLAERCRPWLERWRRDLGAPGFNPFDTLAVARLTHPELLKSFEAGVWIEEGPDDSAPREEREAGRTKPHLLVDPDRAAPRATYCHEPLPAFKPLLLERLVG